MLKKDCEPQKPVSFSGEELKEIIAMTQANSKSNRQIIFIDREKCDAIFIFIEKFLKAIRRHHVRKLITYGAKNITLTKSNNELEYEIVFKQKGLKRNIFEKLHNNTKMRITIKNKKSGSVLSVILEKEAAKKLKNI